MHRWLLPLLLTVWGCSDAPKTTGTPTKPAAIAEEPTARLQILDYDGIQKLIQSKHGKVVVMDAWSTSCPPCIKEFHNLVELQNKIGFDRLACISLSFDYEGIGKPQEVEPKVLAFLMQQHATFDNVLSSEESDILYRKFELASVPAVFVYDQDGNLVKRFDNESAKSEAEAFTYEQVTKLVEDLLAKK